MWRFYVPFEVIMHLTVNVRIVSVGKLYMAITNLGGITIRGRAADEPSDAVRNLFFRLQNPNDDDATVALELGITGKDLNILALGDGSRDAE